MPLWSILNGTIVNVLTVATGSAVGLLLSTRIPDRYQRIVLACLGLITILLGVDASVMELNKSIREFGSGIPTYGARLAMVVVGSLIVGALLGTALRLHERIEGLGALMHRRLTAKNPAAATPMDAPAAGDSRARFAEGFLSASVIFCVGPLTLLGCLNNGAHGDPSLLYIKSLMDGFCSMALAATLGMGVLFSVLTVLVFQGGLALTAYYVAGALPQLSLNMMNVVGGLVLLATAMMILEIKRMPVANLMPGILLAPVFVWVIELVRPGFLLTQ